MSFVNCFFCKTKTVWILMSSIDQIEEYKKAIDFTGDLARKQKDILKYVISFDLEKGVTTETIRNVANITRQAASVHLQRLMYREFVFRKKDRIYKYFVIKEKLDSILDEYRAALSLKQK